MITIDALNEIFGFEFSDEQLESITADLDRPLQVVAGAGSGKTTVMVARIVWAVGSGALRPDQVLGLTFTNKAAGELGREVVAKLQALDDKGLLPHVPDELGRGDDGAHEAASAEVDEPSVGTYHKFANQLVSDFGLRVGIEPGSRLLVEGEPEHLAYRLVNESNRPLQVFESSAHTIAGYVLTLDQELSEQVVSTDQLRTHSVDLINQINLLSKTVKGDLAIAEVAEQRMLLADLVDDFREYKRELGVVDFSDLMRAAERLSHVDVVVDELRERYKLVLLDEYQDTSIVQARFLHNFFGAGHPVTAVGDPFQAIYGWRGASEMAMSEFPGLFTQADGSRAKQTHLTASRRCAPKILSTANRVAEPLRDSFPDVRELRSVGSEHQVNTVETAMLFTLPEEHEWIGQAIESLVQSGVAPSEIAVLCRENKTMKPVIEELGRRGVKSQITDIGGLLSQPEVLDLVSWLAVLNDPGANPALLRILQGPRWRIGPRDLALLGRRAKDLARQSQMQGEGPTAESVDEHLANNPANVGSLNTELERATQGVDVVDVPCLLDAVESPYDRDGDPRYPYSEECLARLEELRGLLTEFRGLNLLSLPELARYVSRATGLESEVNLAALSKSADSHGGIALDRGLNALSVFYELLGNFGVDAGDKSLSAFINWLDVSRIFENEVKLDLPITSDAVQFLTVHGAKGLEWKYVFVPRMVDKIFPSANPRPRWTSRPERVPHALRGDRDAIPDQDGFGTKAAEAFRDQMKEHAEREERRLAYVAFTRAKEGLFVSGSWWDANRATPLEFSDYLAKVGESVLETGGVLDQWVLEPGDEHPLTKGQELVAWPRPLNSEAFGRRIAAHQAIEVARSKLSLDPLPSTSVQEQTIIDQWDTDLRLLLAERRSRAERAEPELPKVLSASQLMAVEKDRSAFLERLVRPMPWPPSAAADRGTRFHSWVEQHYGISGLFDEIPGEQINDQLSEEELANFKDYFLSTGYANRDPFAVELSFDYLLGGTVVNGRIDAVFKTEVGGRTQWEVVDWKTNREPNADPLQLAVYAVAIQRMFGADPADVTGSFVYVQAQEIVTYQAVELADESEIAAIFSENEG